MSQSILIFLDWFTPGYKAGGPISSNANLLDHLQDKFQFHVITRDTDYCETTPYPTIKSNHWNTQLNGAEVFYISFPLLNYRNIIKISKQVECDTVYINGIYSWYFSLFPLLYFKYFTNKKVIVAARGMLSDHTFSVRKSKKKIFYTLVRILGIYRNITFHATNKEEADQIRKNVGFKGSIHIAPNLPPKIHIKKNVKTIKKVDNVRLISIARISHEKNTLYALQILEKLASTAQLKDSSEIIFDLYGTVYSPEYFTQCEEVVKRLPSNISVNFMGTLVKDQIADTLSKYHFLFMPTQGENYGHSIVESMIAGCPVIISDRTPWRELTDQENSVGWDISLDKPEDFVTSIYKCLNMSQEEYLLMSNNAREYILEKTGNPKVMEASIALFS